MSGGMIILAAVQTRWSSIFARSRSCVLGEA